ncbi:ubiquitin-conjugating enzyme/RWD-like protein [Kalaharituber pfeilii]|nr:ubiquitin-conjugating enzyme/RWD-like protein [Kalaharituber pfeilii]
MSVTAGAAKRLLGELKEYSREPQGCLEELAPVGDNLQHWTAIMKGVEGTPYERGRWLLDIRVPKNYPFEPPVVKFVTPICHPNIHLQTGDVCVDLLKTTWSPAYTLKLTIMAIQSLLTTPEPDSPLNVDAANLLKAGDYVGYDSLVKVWVVRFAQW